MDDNGDQIVDQHVEAADYLEVLIALGKLSDCALNYLFKFFDLVDVIVCVLESERFSVAARVYFSRQCKTFHIHKNMPLICLPDDLSPPELLMIMLGEIGQHIRELYINYSGFKSRNDVVAVSTAIARCCENIRMFHLSGIGVHHDRDFDAQIEIPKLQNCFDLSFHNPIGFDENIMSLYLDKCCANNLKSISFSSGNDSYKCEQCEPHSQYRNRVNAIARLTGLRTVIYSGWDIKRSKLNVFLAVTNLIYLKLFITNTAAHHEDFRSDFNDLLVALAAQNTVVSLQLSVRFGVWEVAETTCKALEHFTSLRKMQINSSVIRKDLFGVLDRLPNLQHLFCENKPPSNTFGLFNVRNFIQKNEKLLQFTLENCLWNVNNETFDIGNVFARPDIIISLKFPLQRVVEEHVADR